MTVGDGLYLKFECLFFFTAVFKKWVLTDQLFAQVARLGPNYIAQRPQESNIIILIR